MTRTCRTRTRRRLRLPLTLGTSPRASPDPLPALVECAARLAMRGEREIPRAGYAPAVGRVSVGSGARSRVSDDATQVAYAVRSKRRCISPLALARVDAPCKPSRRNASPRLGAGRAVLARRRPGPKQRRSEPVERQLRAQGKLPTACCAREDGCAKRPSACAARHGLVPQRTPLQVVNHRTERNARATSSDRRTSTASSPRLQPSAAKKSL